MRSAAEAVLGPACFAVRALLFDKTPEANWKVIWHQDLTIAVRERRPVEGFGPWSEKADIAMCSHPPRSWSGWWPCVYTSMTAARRTARCASFPAPTARGGSARKTLPRGASAPRPSSVSCPEADCW